MKTLENNIKNAETKVLINTLIYVMGDFSKMKLNVMIQEELEYRIGEDKLDDILDANR